MSEKQLIQEQIDSLDEIDSELTDIWKYKLPDIIGFAMNIEDDDLESRLVGAKESIEAAFKDIHDALKMLKAL